MNKEYVKINCTLKDKLLFLFTGIIKREKLINNIQETVNKETVNKETVKDVSLNKEFVDSIPDKLDIPFFELNNTNVQSNLDE